MTRTLVGLVALAVVVYGGFKAEALILGPSLSVAAPKNGERVEGGALAVVGNAKRITGLSLDGAPLLPDAEGNFSATLAFPRGTSILTFAASDRFGRQVVALRTIYVP